VTTDGAAPAVLRLVDGWDIDADDVAMVVRSGDKVLQVRLIVGVPVAVRDRLRKKDFFVWG
jgi:hypothetical protein